MTLAELKEKWEELFIRFNTSPKLYLKIDFLKLLKFLKNIVDRGTGLIEDDLKTINGESLVGDDDFSLVEKDHIKTINGESLIGDGNIEIKGLSIEEGNAISIKDVPIYSEPTFLGYTQINSLSTTLDDSQDILILDNSDPNAETYYYKLVAEEQESTHITTELNFEHFVGTKLYFDDECTEYIGTVTNAAIANNKVLYFSLDTPLEQLEGQIPRNYDGNHNFISVWGIIQIGVKPDTKEISVTSHIYDEENNNCKFGRDNTIEGEHSVAFGSNNEIEGLPENPIEFIGYCKAPGDDEYFDIDDEDYTLVPHGTDADDREFHYKLLSERSEDAESNVEDIPDLVGSVLYADSEGTMPLGIVSKSMYAYGMRYGDYTAIIYFSLDQYPTDIPRSFISVWRLIPADRSENSIVHGFSNLVCADNAHAEGKDTEALENQAHSEGEFTVAQGINSHSEGQYTTAFGTASHAEGEGGHVTLFKVKTDDEDLYKLHYLTSSGSGSTSDSSFNFLAGSDFTSDVLFGDSASDVTEKYGIEKANKYAGWVGRTLYNADGSILGTIVRFPDKTQGELGNWFIVDKETNINDYISAYIKTGASGEDSHSEGYLSDAAGKYSHAEGERTRVTGTAAHGEGTRTQAYGAYSHAEGEQTQALAFGAHSEGKYTHAEGEYTHVEGYDTKASGLYAHAEGIHSSAQGEGSHAEGYNCSTDGNTVFKPTEYVVNVYNYDEDSDELTLSISEGSGIYNFGRLLNTFKTILFRNLANAKFYLINYKVSRFDADNDLIILGKDLSVRSGASCIKYPEYIYVDNDYRVYKEITSVAAHAEGKDTAASETASHSEGINTRADGDAAHAEGIDSKALSKYAHAEGINTYVSEHSEGSHTEGFETQVKSNYSHAEGYKTDIKESAIGSHAEGFETLVEGQYSHAEGVKTETKNYAEHVLGFRNKSHYNSDNWGDKGNTLFSVGSGGSFIDAYVSEPEFIGYLKGTEDWLEYNTWLYYAGSDESVVLNNCLILEQQEGTTSDIADIPNLIGSLLFLDDTKTKYLGKVISAARCSSSEDEDKSKCRIYLSLDTGFSAKIDPGIALSTWKVEKTEDTEPVYTEGEDQSNALEITQNGSIYVRGIGDYRGDNIDSAVSLQTLIKRADPLKIEPLFEVIAAALNDLNTRVNSIDAVASATLVNHEDRIQTLEE